MRHEEPVTTHAPLAGWKRGLADWLLEERLPAFARGWVHARIRADHAWSAHYDALRRAERAAAGGVAVSRAQADLVKAMLFARATPVERPSRSWMAAPALGTAAAAVALLIGLRGGSDGAEWTPRGSGDAAVGIRVQCVDETRARVLAEAEAGSATTVKGPVLACPKSGLLSFSLTNLSQRPLHVLVVGVGDDGGLRWYAPFGQAAPSVAVEAGAVNRTLETLADMRGMADDETVALFALFDEKPLAAGKIIAALAEAQRAGLAISSLPRLPVPVRMQARIDLDRRGADR